MMYVVPPPRVMRASISGVAAEVVEERSCHDVALWPPRAHEAAGIV